MIHCLFGDEQRHNALCSEILGKDECGIPSSKGKRNIERVLSLVHNTLEKNGFYVYFACIRFFTIPGLHVNRRTGSPTVQPLAMVIISDIYQC